MNDQPNTPNPIPSRSEKVRVWLETFAPYVAAAGKVLAVLLVR